MKEKIKAHFEARAARMERAAGGAFPRGLLEGCGLAAYLVAWMVALGVVAGAFGIYYFIASMLHFWGWGPTTAPLEWLHLLEYHLAYGQYLILFAIAGQLFQRNKKLKSLVEFPLFLAFAYYTAACVAYLFGGEYLLRLAHLEAFHEAYGQYAFLFLFVLPFCVAALAGLYFLARRKS